MSNSFSAAFDQRCCVLIAKTTSCSVGAERERLDADGPRGRSEPSPARCLSSRPHAYQSASPVMAPPLVRDRRGAVPVLFSLSVSTFVEMFDTACGTM